MSNHNCRLTFLIVLFGLALGGPARAAVFCVETSSELDQALSTAASNSEDDEIRIKVGNYLTPTGGFIHTIEDGHDLTISGGWSDFNSISCLINLGDPDETALDGGNIGGILRIQAQSGMTGNLTIRNLAFIRAQGDDFASALFVYSPSGLFAGTILIDRVQFSGNVGTKGSALRIIGGDRIYVRNSLFVFNRCENGTGVVTAAGGSLRLYFINNTFMFNQHGVESPGANDASALFVDFSAGGTVTSQVFIANNLFWANETPDLFTNASGTTYIYNNNYLQRVGPAPEFEGGNLSVDPMLVQPGIDFTPALGSPLIDSGRAEPTPPIPFPPPFSLDWSHGTQDFYNSLFGRVKGEGVDIGAVESNFLDKIFSDRFQP